MKKLFLFICLICFVGPTFAETVIFDDGMTYTMCKLKTDYKNPIQNTTYGHVTSGQCKEGYFTNNDHAPFITSIVKDKLSTKTKDIISNWWNPPGTYNPNHFAYMPNAPKNNVYIIENQSRPRYIQKIGDDYAMYGSGGTNWALHDGSGGFWMF